MSYYNIFISHAWKYSDAYSKVVRWIDEAESLGKLSWKNYSVPYHDPVIANNTHQLQQNLINQINPASIVIIISGMYTAYSKWIDFEIDVALEKKKYIIGLKPWAQEKIPIKIQDNANVMVGWNGSSVISAILDSKK